MDRFGLGWRAEIASDVLANLDRIDVIELIAENLFRAPEPALRAFRSLRRHVDLVLHGVSMGLASCRPVRRDRVRRVAEVRRRIGPVYWSEHLAFVRGGGFELNALAAPPRNEFTVRATVANILRAGDIIGMRPVVENVASLLDPPGSDRDQATWLVEVITAADCDLLLDLHNVHANAFNFGFDAAEFVSRLPAERIAAVHLAGGKILGRGRHALRLDTHTDDVPAEVFALLELVGERAPRPLHVILEWDGDYPPIHRLLAQLDRARRALARGRARRDRAAVVPASAAEALALETVLARLYADPDARRRFAGKRSARGPGLSRALMGALAELDPRRLSLTAAGVAGGVNGSVSPSNSAGRRRSAG